MNQRMAATPFVHASAELAGLRQTVMIPVTEPAWRNVSQSLTARPGPTAAAPTTLMEPLRASLVDKRFHADLTRTRDLIAALGANSRQLVIFATGLTGLANQSVAQFTGWSIPGVGEGANRTKPRTRLYDTTDPDTLAQVVESMNFDECALIFLADSYTAPVRLQAETILPRSKKAIGSEALSRRLACIHTASGAGSDVELANLVADHGGRVLELDGRSDPLSVPGLLAGIARDLDPVEVRAGALQVVETALTDASWGGLFTLWGRIGQAASQPCSPTLMIPYADRLARFTAWAGAYWNANLADRLTPMPRQALASPQAMHGQDLRGLGIPIMPPALIELHGVRLEATDAQPFLDHGHAVRLLSLDEYSPRTFGALIAQVMIDSCLAAGADC